MRIRVAVPTELLLLQDIERAAGEAFRPLGMAEIADDDPLPLDVLESYRRAGRAWVAVDATDRPVAYLLTDTVDGAAHIEQVSVHPDAARRGVGRALIEHLAGTAREQGLTALTLTTFAEVPWNAPYYTRLGFRRLDEGDPALTGGLRAIARAEAAHGLAAWPRVCMRRELTPADAGGPAETAGPRAAACPRTATAPCAVGPQRPLSPPRTAPAAPPSAPSR
ncbi:GNAT family N-acetyltransferase [Streptomyces roseicoloratus]|uniref:GNAT family N-acetyltransferase n=1 Tax=Streptomyces roseicoloratus TaxID=2508722 RepID=A0ABY9RRE5_9ACTN|nr:GNAT family N-acetyltransferase [Streptomyces roseicoloratus]WMX44318.1 GNAT family N-acetyltransferase [Streptomyces roseicoloratus]